MSPPATSAAASTSTTPAARLLRTLGLAALLWLAPGLATLLAGEGAGLAPAAAAPAGPGTVARPDPADPDGGFAQRLHDTGLYAAGRPGVLAPGVAAFSPQYPLWSDGADKQRWLWLPPGTAIDAAQADAWQFPVGTRLWKQFALAGRPVETRLIERRADGRWHFASYLWNSAGTDARLAPAAGVPAWPVKHAPQGRYAVPSRADCLACHGGAATPVLGLGALQLSPDRDPLAPHATPRRRGELDLRALVARGWLTGLDPALLATPPRVLANTPVERAALGYLHGNCAHCHHAGPGRVPVRLVLAQSVADPAGSRRAVLASMVGAASRYRPAGLVDPLDDEARTVRPGDAAASVLLHRLRERRPPAQMPPLGSAVADADALALLHRWINHDLAAAPAALAGPQRPGPPPSPNGVTGPGHPAPSFTHQEPS